MAKRTAIIDIGSNSIRLVVYEKSSRFAFRLLHEVKSRVRLSENAYQNDLSLQEEAMQRTVDALTCFSDIINSYKARKVLCVATSALRDAPNKNDFIARVKESSGINIKVISGEKEAYFGALSCALLLPHKDAISIDIGGGSCEIALIKDSSIDHTLSLKLGTVRLKELFLDSGDIDGAKKYIRSSLESLEIPKDLKVIGVGGTFRALAQIIMQNSKYPLDKLHGFSFNIDEFKLLAKDILDANKSKLKTLGVKKDRLDVIQSGTLILLELLKYFNTKDLVTSGVGVREGVYLADLLRNSKHKFPANYNPSVRYLLDVHNIQDERTNSMAKISKAIFEAINSTELHEKYKRVVVIASKLSKVGSSIHYYSYHKHSFYMIQSALEYGFTHEEVVLISMLARFQKKKYPNDEFINKFETLLPNERVLKLLTFIVTLSSMLSINSSKHSKMNISFNNDILEVGFENLNTHLIKEQVLKLTMPDGIEVKIS